MSEPLAWSAARSDAVLAVDIGGTTTKIALVDNRGDLQHWRCLPTAGASAAAFLEALAAQIEQVRQQAEQPVLAVAVAMAGFVNAEGVMTYNPNLPWLEHAPVAAVLAGRLRLRVHAETDSNAACVAEYIFGQGQGARRFLCLTGGTGMGVGMIADGKLMRPAHGGLGDAGHVVVAPAGPVCSCGGKGCAEAVLSTELLGRQYGAASGKDATFRSLVRDAQLGEPLALALLAEAGQSLGILAASLTSIFFPDRIAVAGGLSHSGENFFAAAETSWRAHCGHFPLEHASLVRASTGEHATLLGAAACAFYPELLGLPNLSVRNEA